MRVNAAKIVSSAILGLDIETIIVNGRTYVIHPPTIKKIAGAGVYMSEFGDEKQAEDYAKKADKFMGLCKALSWFIKGDESLTEDLSEGLVGEVIHGLEVAMAMVSAENFYKLSRLARNVQTLIAKQK